MKYDFVFKLNSVELYRNGRWPDTPEGINQKNFRKRVKTWAKLADLHGIDALRHPTTCTEYTAEERYNLVARVLAGKKQKSVAIIGAGASGLMCAVNLCDNPKFNITIFDKNEITNMRKWTM